MLPVRERFGEGEVEAGGGDVHRKILRLARQRCICMI
jgi:hypothetical protein